MSKPTESYALDANTFIQAKRRFYPLDIAPGYWELLRWYRTKGRVCSVDKVRDELKRGNDDLWVWAKTVFDETGFHDTSIAIGESADAGVKDGERAKKT